MDAPRATPGSDEHGFTLLEVLLALTLAAMLLTLLTAGFHLTIRDWNSENSRFHDKIEQSLALLQIERALEGAWPHLYEEQEEGKPRPEKVIFFLGEPKGLAWVSTVSPGRQQGLFAWRIAEGDQGGVRINNVPAYVGNPAPRLAEATAMVADEIDSAASLFYPDHRLELLYLAPPASLQEERKWLTEWDGRERLSLPLAVHIKLVPNSGNPAALYQAIALIAAHEHAVIKPKQP